MGQKVLLDAKELNIILHRLACQLIENQDKIQEMGRAALKASQNYKPENIMNKWFELFDEIANK